MRLRRAPCQPPLEELGQPHPRERTKKVAPPAAQAAIERLADVQVVWQKLRSTCCGLKSQAKVLDLRSSKHRTARGCKKRNASC